MPATSGEDVGSSSIRLAIATLTAHSLFLEWSKHNQRIAGWTRTTRLLRRQLAGAARRWQQRPRAIVSGWARGFCKTVVLM